MHRDSRGRPKCSLLVHSRDVISLMKPAFVWLGFRGPNCNVIAEKGGGPDARLSWAGSGPRAGGCPTLAYSKREYSISKKYNRGNYVSRVLDRQLMSPSRKFQVMFASAFS